jgi:2,4-dienoyl-CoA reductase (NADPH2)
MKKAWDSQPNLINTCIGCNQACLDHAFVGKTASCLVNPAACHEDELTPYKLPAERRRKIGVIGSGPAGCAFAITAAKMGHDVTLYDRSDDVGGQFHMAKRIPGKEEFYEALRYFRESLKDTGVTLKMGTEVSIDDMESLSSSGVIDEWIVATGVTPRDPKIPGQEHPNVLNYIDVLKHNVKVGDRVAVIGAGGIGFDVSEFLLYHDHDRSHQDLQDDVDEFWNEWGVDRNQSKRGGLKKPQPKPPLRQIHLLQRKHGKLGAGLGRTTGWIHRASLKHGNVKMIDGCKYSKIDENGYLHYTDKNGESQVLEVDNIVFCAGQVEEKTLEIQASGRQSLAGHVYTIGGAYKAGELDAKRAIDMGTRLAIRIHEDAVTPDNHVSVAPVGTEEKLFKLLKRFS